MLTLASLALGASSQQPGGAASSRLPLSRIAEPNAPLQQLQRSSDVLLDCVPESVKCLRGGASGTKCDVVLVGCGVPKRGMGWYHGKQMLDGDVPSAELTAVVEPWFLGAGADSAPGQTFKQWADDMEKEHGTKFVKDISELTIKVRACPFAALFFSHTSGALRLEARFPSRAWLPVLAPRARDGGGWGGEGCTPVASQLARAAKLAPLRVERSQ
jgi:hypothetical protein